MMVSAISLASSVEPESRGLFALLDAARDKAVYTCITSSGLRYESLYHQAGEIERFGPFLLGLERDEGPPAGLFENRRQTNWGIILAADLSLDRLRRHLRHFLLVSDPEGRECYFRFYDPRVLRVFFERATFKEIARLFGDVDACWIESEDGRSIIRYSICEGRITTSSFQAR